MQYSNIKGYPYSISKLTLGTAALGMDYGISNDKGMPALQESLDMLSCAMRAGINTVDTARHYGTAETIIGEFLHKEQESKHLNLITKFRISNENLFNKVNARKEAYKSIRDSMEVLNCDRIPICLFHKRMNQPLDQVLEVVPGIIDGLISDGLIDMGGVSVYDPVEAESYLCYDNLNFLQVPINVFDQRLIRNGMLRRLHLANKIIFARSVFLQGLFFINQDQLAEHFLQARDALNMLHELAGSAKMSIAQLAFSYVRDLSGISSMIFGAVNASQINQNIIFLEGAPLRQDIKDSIEFLFADMPIGIITPGLWPT